MAPDPRRCAPEARPRGDAGVRGSRVAAITATWGMLLCAFGLVLFSSPVSAANDPILTAGSSILVRNNEENSPPLPYAPSSQRLQDKRNKQGTFGRLSRALGLRGGKTSVIYGEFKLADDELYALGQAVCSTCNMRRSKRFMKRNLTTGGYSCKPGRRCGEIEETGWCVRHGKQRRMSALKQGKRGLLCIKEDCTQAIAGNCKKCGKEAAEDVRMCIRSTIPSTLTRFLPQQCDYTHKDDQFLLCKRCAVDYDKHTIKIRAGYIKEYQKFLKERLLNRMHRCKSSNKMIKLLNESLELGYPHPGLVGMNLSDFKGDYVSLLSKQCRETGKPTPKIRLKAIKQRLERVRKNVEPGTTRFPVSFRLSTQIGDKFYNMTQGIKNEAYYAVGNSYLKRTIRKKVGQKSKDHHREWYWEMFGEAVGRRNFRVFGMEWAARHAIFGRVEEIFGEKLDKHGRGVIDLLIDGPSLERRAVHRKFKGRKSLSKIEQAVREFTHQVYFKTKNWLYGRRFYDVEH